MTPLFTVTLLAGTLLPQANFRIDVLQYLDVRQTRVEALAWLEFSQDLEQPEVIYFDAPLRTHGGIIRR